ncbi:hypothetical protein GCM10010124_29870 [Pilimelia terevasa]|uniref:DUF6458 domain-containing protein n=1 Tax=Pilimelia terevasa TaxID=53372 RepID=A0A8J3BU38_9ACTN|nr:DUF6458 family protein [Pilimelia terevasa]GGK35200.1 hypothetical protein GCM10010124_29870 [Pilimelia terevasa]
MGIGGGIFLIAVGAILAYAIKVDVDFIDLRVTGWVFILTGLTTVLLTVWYLMSRRRRPATGADKSVLQETRIAHGHAVVDPEPIASHLRPPLEP